MRARWSDNNPVGFFFIIDFVVYRDGGTVVR